MCQSKTDVVPTLSVPLVLREGLVLGYLGYSNMDSEARVPGFNLAKPLPCCVCLGQLLSLSVHQFSSSLKQDVNSTCFIALCRQSENPSKCGHV